MTIAKKDEKLMLERYADGELSGQDLAEVESLLEQNPAALEYLEGLRTLRGAIHFPVHAEADAANFDNLFSRVFDRVDQQERELARSAAMDRKVVAYVDGELSDANELATIKEYLARHAEARDGAETIAELGKLVRAPVEFAAGEVNFDALARRIDRALDQEDAQRALARETKRAEAQPGVFDRIAAFFKGNVGAFVSAAAGAAVVLIMVPMVNRTQQPTEPETLTPVINNYYYQIPRVDSVSYEKGFTGYSKDGDKAENLPPVIWIEPAEAPSNPARFQKETPVPPRPAPEGSGSEQ